MSSPHSLVAEDALRELRQTLRKLKTPAKLNDDAVWLNSPLIQQKRLATPEISPYDALRTVFDDSLSQLKRQNTRYADLLKGRYWEGLSVNNMLAQNRPEPQSESRFHQQHKQALALFLQTLRAAERQCAQHAQAVQYLSHLPVPSYNQLFGIDHHLEVLTNLLTEPRDPWLISIEGIGGIGKTALAHAAICRVIEQNAFVGYS